MLATNQKVYRQVLSMSDVTDEASGEVDWDKFFQGTGVYQKTYF